MRALIQLFQDGQWFARLTEMVAPILEDEAHEYTFSYCFAFSLSHCCHQRANRQTDYLPILRSIHTRFHQR